MNILMLMGGDRVAHGDGQYPVYMTELGGRMVLERQIDNCRMLSPVRMVFCVRAGDAEDFHIDDVIRQSSDNAVCVKLNGKTHGSICTALLASEYIDDDEELVVMAADDLIDADFRAILDFFRAGDCDAGLVSFDSAHPRYSFARLDADGTVSETAEKRPISRHALASLYYFRKGREFVECAKEVIRKDERINNEFFISQSVNEMILRRGKVLLHTIPASRFHPLKNEMQLAQYMRDLKVREEVV